MYRVLCFSASNDCGGPHSNWKDRNGVEYEAVIPAQSGSYMPPEALERSEGCLVSSGPWRPVTSTFNSPDPFSSSFQASSASARAQSIIFTYYLRTNESVASVNPVCGGMPCWRRTRGGTRWAMLKHLGSSHGQWGPHQARYLNFLAA